MNVQLFKEGIETLSGMVTEKQLSQFIKYSDILVDWNTRMNLTAVTDPDGIAVKHFLDSVLPIYHVDFSEIKSIADVGTGAGFPGVPMAIMMPDIQFTLIDSLNKRVNFLNHVKDEIGLKNVTCIHGRAEDLGKDKHYREGFDCVVSRAVANMTVLCEYCLPYVKVGGMLVALKADGCEEEVCAAKSMIGNLGGIVQKTVDAKLPKSDILRKLVVVEKVNKTPDRFPRRGDKIKKSQSNLK